MSTKRTLKDRIRAAYRQTNQYHEMLCLVFPEPSAHRCRTGGGPPACAMPFGKALREMGGWSFRKGTARIVWIPEARHD